MWEHFESNLPVCTNYLGTVNSKFKKDLNLQIHLDRELFPDNWFSRFST